METKELVISEKDLAVFAISLVEEPAIEEDFIFLSKTHEIELKVTDEEKRIVTGYALIPDKEIYRRNNEGEEFNIVFSKETVLKASQLFLSNQHQKDITSEHKDKVKGVSVVESWITEDEKHDKVNLYKIKPIVGGWVVSMKIDNDEEWAKVKDKKYKGFSIEGGFSEAAKLSKDKSILEQIKEILCHEK